MASRVPKKNQSMVPILFTLGVIGWGFFVIDRITRPPLPRKHPVEKKMHNVPASTNNSWKDSLLSIVDRFDKEKEQQQQNQKSLSVIDEDGSSFIQKYSPLKEKTKTAPPQAEQKIEPKLSIQSDPIDRSAQNENQTARVYFFQFGEGELPHLSFVKRNFSNDDLMTNVFRAVVQGPLEHERDIFVDSFPIKPRLHSVTILDDVLILDFNEDFGRSVSLPMLILQFEQLLKTAEQFKSYNIRITINGEQKSYIGGDGLSLPYVINQELLLSLRN